MDGDDELRSGWDTGCGPFDDPPAKMFTSVESDRTALRALANEQKKQFPLYMSHAAPVALPFPGLVADDLHRQGGKSSNTAIRGALSKATTANPKDLVGSNKVSLTKLPAIAVIQGGMAMMDGAGKYGPYNWRAKPVTASIYVDAALRHLYTWFEGQETATDSKVHHLGHVIGCCAILLDAQATKRLIDDRPILKDESESAEDLDFLEKQLNALSEIVKQKKLEKEFPSLAENQFTFNPQRLQ